MASTGTRAEGSQTACEGLTRQESTQERLRGIMRQNSNWLSGFAEDVVLPPNKRSINRGRVHAVPDAHQMHSLAYGGHGAGDVSVVDMQPGAGKVPFDKDQLPKAFPVFMLTVSGIQIICFYGFGHYALLWFGYDPYRRHEIWRYATIMFAHSSGLHLWTNLFFQLILGCLLERVHHWKRIGGIYVGAVIGGTLAVSILDPQQYAVGASAGVYGLLTSHLATIIINWNEMDRKCCRVFWLLGYIAFDVGLTVYSTVVQGNSGKVSHAGHFGGALTGFLLSTLILRNFEKLPWERTLQRVCMCVLGIFVLITVTVNVSFPSYYLKSEFNFKYEDTYICYLLDHINKSEAVRKVCEADAECRQVLQDFKNGKLDSC